MKEVKYTYKKKHRMRRMVRKGWRETGALHYHLSYQVHRNIIRYYDLWPFTPYGSYTMFRAATVKELPHELSRHMLSSLTMTKITQKITTKYGKSPKRHTKSPHIDGKWPQRDMTTKNKTQSEHKEMKNSQRPLTHYVKLKTSWK